MLNGGVRLQPAETTISPDRSRPASAMAGLFAPLEMLLSGGGDSRLTIYPASGLNEYGCQPHPCPETLSFSSSTATSISQRAWNRAQRSREALMQSAIAVGIEEAFDGRVEAMRDELRAALGLPRAMADVVFSPSGTDSQLQALFLAKALLGNELTTVVVAADQTGSGTAHTSRGCHFSAATANGRRVQKGEPIEGLAGSVKSVALPLFDATGQARAHAASDSMVFDAVERVVAGESKVLLQVMDASKFGWRAPSDQCLEAITARWGRQVQVVVDACQMRLGRTRLKNYLARGYFVLVTGSKFFTGPPFSGALLVPASFAGTLDSTADVPCGLFEYVSRSDWPKDWTALRAHFPIRTNLGQWLRWEAAIEEIAAYYRVPDEFRKLVLNTFGRAIEARIAASSSLELLPWQERTAEADDEELAQRTIFSFVIRRGDRIRTLEQCKGLYRALAATPVASNHSSADARPCLIGQPVALGSGPSPVAALRISAGARLVSEAWSPDKQVASRNLDRVVCDVDLAVANLEKLDSEPDVLNSGEMSHAG
jgi:hypothetical protein